jgi:GNAT superfamily N-acetyltransferase
VIGALAPLWRGSAPPRPAPPPAPPPCGGAHDPCAPLRLDDGRSVRVQPLRRDDAAAEQAFFGALSRQSRYRRFHAGLPHLPLSLLAHMVDVDQVLHVALAARPEGEARIVADARYVVDADDASGADFAIAVADDWQGRGLARRLLARLARHAAGHGVTHLHGDVLWDNRPMIELVHWLGGSLRKRPDEAGVLQAVFRTTRR